MPAVSVTIVDGCGTVVNTCIVRVRTVCTHSNLLGTLHPGCAARFKAVFASSTENGSSRHDANKSDDD